MNLTTSEKRSDVSGPLRREKGLKIDHLGCRLIGFEERFAAKREPNAIDDMSS